jgi:hypothetical protein
MAVNFGDRQKQIAAEFWKSYFAKFRHPANAPEHALTGNASQFASKGPVSLLIERRRNAPRLGADFRR